MEDDAAYQESGAFPALAEGLLLVCLLRGKQSSGCGLDRMA